MATKNIQSLVDKHYEKLFDELCEISDDFHDILIEVKEKTSGLTVRRSWKDRDLMIKEEELNETLS